MLHYIIGCIVSLFVLIILEYLADRPILWNNCDDAISVSEPRIDFSSFDSCRYSEHQKAVYTLLSTYHSYHSKLATLRSWQISESESLIARFFWYLLFFALFHYRQFPDVFDSETLRILFGIAIYTLLFLISNFVYKRTPFHFQKVDLTLNQIQNDFNSDRWMFFKSGSSFAPSQCSQIIENCPLASGGFSSFSLFAISYRLAYMDSVYDSVLIRHSIYKAVDFIAALAYILLLPHRID